MNGRRAGSAFERECVELLKRWWDPHEEGEWARTPLSGGWSSPRHRAAFRTAGDVVTTCATFPFSVECKRRRAIHLEAVVAGTSGEFRKAWEQADAGAAESGLEPLLLFRRPRLPVLAAVYAGTVPLNPGDWLRVRVAYRGPVTRMRVTDDLAVAPAEALLALEPKEVVTYFRLADNRGSSRRS